MANEPPLFVLDAKGRMVSRPNRTGDLDDLLQQPHPTDSNSAGKSANRKELYEAFRMLAMHQAAQLITRPRKSSSPHVLGDRVELCTALASFDIAMEMDEKAANKDAEFLIYYIHLSFEAENYPHIPYYNRLLDTAKRKSDLFEKFQAFRKDIMRITNEVLALGRFTLDYRDRVQKGWETITPKLSKLCKLKKEDAEEFCLDLAFHLSSYMGIQGIFSPPTAKNGKCSIQLSTIDLETELYPMLYAAEHMPEQLRDRVELSCESPHAARDVRDVLKEQPIYQNLRFALKESEGHNGVVLSVYGPNLQGLDQDSICRVQSDVTSILMDLLGHYSWYFAIQSVTVPQRGTPPVDAVSLAQLPQALQDLGYSLNITLANLEQTLHRTYTGTPSSGTQLRADIVTGETTCFKLHAEYMAGRTEAADHLIFMGVTPCFLAWPKSIIPDDETAFCHRLLTYLEEQEPSPLYKVLGTASGSQYFYLDLLSWSIDNFIKDVEAYFATVPGGDQVLLQGFRHGSRPGPATLERLMRFDDAKGMEDTPDKARSGSSQASAKKKAKHKKKRKK